MNQFIKHALKYYGTNPESWDFPWCAAFANKILKEAGVKGTDSYLARSFLEIGEAKAQGELGDIVVFWRGEKGSIWGHNGFYVAENELSIYVLGGNQSNTTNIKAFPKHRLLGIRRIENEKCT